jgi:carboxypeptidase Taq
LIRTDADELTYNLHVMIRVELEIALLEGRLQVKDLPEAWNEAYRSNLGVVPKNDAEGVLQDIHWYCDMVGGSFQGYTIGNVLASQFYEAAKRAHPSLEADFTKGEFSSLKAWLNKNVHCHGRALDTHELVKAATGKPIDVTEYLNYLKQKYQ